MSNRFDVFLSHNSRDKPAVERLAEKLKRAGLEPWLDKWCLTPGGKWQDELAAGLRASSACAFFIGPNGVGDWASEELSVALDRAAKDRAFRLFLVLLPAVPEPFDPTTLPPFLSTRTWIDIRKGLEDSRSFQQLINAVKGVAPGSETDIAPRTDIICPYRGLQTFNEEHAEFFFGRNGDVQRLLEKLKATRFLAVIGSSGSGKSSVVRAGLIPKLRAGALPDSHTWKVRVLTPGAHPLTTLAAHLLRLFPQDTMQKTLDQMTTDPRTLHLAGSLALAERPPSELVVWVIDQFEEVFTLCRDEQERKQFLDNLLYAASIPDGRSAVMLTMRADFYPRCAAYPDLSARIAAQQFLVSPMDLDGLRQAIEAPAWRVGLEFEEGLVATVLDDIVNEPGALPLLEHALLELWERRRGRMMTLEAYRESGGVRGAIAKRADTVYAAFNESQQEIVRRIMLRLTQPGEGTEDTRRRATMSELITSPGESEAVESVVRAMADARLLTAGADEQSGERLVDVSHEALIRGWPRLRKWIDEDRSALRVHRRLTEAGQEWQRLNRDEGVLYRGARLAQAVEWRERHEAMLNASERQFLDASVALQQKERRARQQRVRLTVVGLSITLVLISGAAFLAFRQRNAANASARGTRFALSGLLATQARTVLETNPQRSLLLAIEALNTTARAREGRVPAAEEALRTALANSGGRPVARDDGPIDGVAVSPNNQWLATVSSSGTRLWNMIPTGQRFQALLLKGGAGPVAFSPDNHWLATGSAERGVLLWDLTTLDANSNPHVVSGRGPMIAFSPDNHWLATADMENNALLWDLTTARPATVPIILRGHTMPVTKLAISPDGNWLVTASNDCLPRNGSHDPTVHLWNLKSTDPASKPIVLRGHDGPIGAIAISPDSHWLATGGGSHGLGICRTDKTVRIWDLTAQDPNAKSEVLSGGDEAIDYVAIGRGNHWLFTIGSPRVTQGIDRRTARLWDLTVRGSPATNVIVEAAKGVPFSVRTAAISPDGGWLATAGNDNITRLWELTAKTPLEKPRLLRGHEGPATSIKFSPDNLSVVTGSEDKTARLWGLTAAEAIASPIVLESEGDREFIVSPDSHWLVTRTADYNAARVWDLTAPDPLKALITLTASKYAFIEFAFEPGSHRLISGSDDGITRLWDLAGKDAGANPIVFRGANSRISAAEISNDKRWLVTGNFDGTVCAWNMTTKEPSTAPRLLQASAKTSEGKSGAVFGLVISPDSHWLITWGDRKAGSFLFDLTASDPAAHPMLLGSVDNSASLNVSLDSHWLATIGTPERDRAEQKSLEDKIRTTKDAQELTKLLEKSKEFDRPLPPKARLWNLRANDPTAEPHVLKDGRSPVLTSPDGHWLVTAGPEGTGLLWDLTAKDPSPKPQVLSGHTDMISRLVFSPDNRRLITGSYDGTARVWDLKHLDSQPIVLRGAGFGVNDVAISADSRRVAIAWGKAVTSRSSALRLWDLAAEDPAASVIVLPTPESISATAFSRDGQDSHWLVTGGRDDQTSRQTVQLWNMRMDELIKLACRTAGRNLSETEWQQYFHGQPYRKTCPDLPDGEGVPTSQERLKGR